MALRRRATASSGGAASPLFPKGAAVEVRLNDEGFQGAWYEATITAAHRSRRTFDVVYASLVSDNDPSQPLTESGVSASNIRPRPPGPAADVRYALHQLVDAFQHDGWWLAVVSAVHGADRYTVSYPISREVGDLAPFEIRPHLDWRRDRWLPAAPADQAGGMFGEGKEVEVSGDRENYGATWYRGTVKKVIEKAIFLVDYEMAKEDGSRDMVSEILDEQYLRPVAPVTPKCKVFGLLEEVEVYRCGGWMAGVVMNVVEGPVPKYTVELMYGKEDEETEVGHAEMRLRREWSDGKWTGTIEENIQCSKLQIHSEETEVQETQFEVKAELTSDTASETVVQEMLPAISTVNYQPQVIVNDVTMHFLTDLVFDSHEAVQKWCREVGEKVNVEVIVMYFEKPLHEGKKLIVRCERSGLSRHRHKNGSGKKRQKTEKCDCPFEIRGVPLDGDKWKLSVINGQHNHELTKSLCHEGSSHDGRTGDLLSTVSEPLLDDINEQPNKRSFKYKMGWVTNDDSVEPFEGPSLDGRTSDTLGTVSSTSRGDTEETNKMSIKCKMGEGPNSCGITKVQCNGQQPPDDQTPDGTSVSPASLGDTEPVGKMSRKCKVGEKPSTDDCSECHGRPSIAGKTSDVLVSSISSLGAPEQINKMCLKRKFREVQSSKIESLQSRKELKRGDPSDPSLGEIYPKTPVVELEFPATMEGCESPPNEKVVGNDAEKTAHQSDPAPVKSSVKTLPFVKSSKLWELIESMEVFRVMPQEPSFRQLEQYGSMEVREGMAIGLMVSFTTLVDSIRSLSIDDSQDSFDEKLKALKPLEENGFDVQRIRSRIEELVEIRKGANKGTRLEEKILETEEEIARLETLRYTLERTIGEVEQSLARLREEKESVDAHMMDDFSVIAKLQKDVHEDKEAFLLAKKRFNTVLDSPW